MTKINFAKITLLDRPRELPTPLTRALPDETAKHAAAVRLVAQSALAAPAVEEVLRRRPMTYIVDRHIAAFSMSSATAFGCET